MTARQAHAAKTVQIRVPSIGRFCHGFTDFLNEAPDNMNFQCTASFYDASRRGAKHTNTLIQDTASPHKVARAPSAKDTSPNAGRMSAWPVVARSRSADSTVNDDAPHPSHTSTGPRPHETCSPCGRYIAWRWSSLHGGTGHLPCRASAIQSQSGATQPHADSAKTAPQHSTAATGKHSCAKPDQYSL